MSQIEAHVQLGLANIAIGVPSEEALAEGAEPRIEVGLTVGLPVSAFRNAQGEALQIPLGTLGLDFDKDEAEQFANTILEAASHLPEPKKTDLLIANNMSAVEAAASEIDKFSGQK